MNNLVEDSFLLIPSVCLSISCFHYAFQINLVKKKKKSHAGKVNDFPWDDPIFTSWAGDFSIYIGMASSLKEKSRYITNDASE